MYLIILGPDSIFSSYRRFRHVPTLDKSRRKEFLRRICGNARYTLFHLTKLARVEYDKQKLG